MNQTMTNMKPIYTILDKNILKQEEDVLFINQKDPTQNGIGKIFKVGNETHVRFANGTEGKIKKPPSFWSKLFPTSNNN